MNGPVPYRESGYAGGLVRVAEVAPEAGHNADDRLNVVLPHFYREFGYGGVRVAMEVARAVTARYRRVRFVSLSPLGSAGEMFDFGGFVADSEGTRVEVAYGGDGGVLPVTPRDIFFCTTWPTALLWQAHAALLAGKGRDPNPFHYFIQDYEPGGYPFGGQHAASLATYGHADHCHAIFNSEELASYFDGMGFAFASRSVLKPSLNEALLAHLEENGFKLRARSPEVVRVLVHGRPQQPRACFGVALEGLDRYLSSRGGGKGPRLELTSAGQPHEDILFHGGVRLRSLGRLSPRDYIARLERTHVGVALSASPHPAYVPLEMAVCGVIAITNDFAAKRLSGAHPNLRSLPLPDPAQLARELEAAVDEAVAAARRSELATTEAVIPANMSTRSWAENALRAGIPHLAAPGG